MRNSAFFTVLLAVVVVVAGETQQAFTLYPADKATNISPDTQLVLRFASPPKIGNSGTIRIIDAATQQTVDTLNLAVPVSPNPSGRAPGNKAPGPNTGDKTVYQKNIIAGLDFHFFPIIVRGNVASVTLHNGALKYGKKYIVRMDGSVLRSNSGNFSTTEWTFSTKAAPPSSGVSKVVVAADGTGDFNTVQGAIDWAPNTPSRRITIFIKNGDYEEIVFAKNKSNLIIRGEDRNRVRVGYPNNSAFNPPKSGPSRRPAFTINEGSSIQLSTFTINNYFIGQAEALLVRGKKIIIDRMTLNGSGDAFTTYGTIYFSNSKLTGHGDTVLGYGAVFFTGSTVESIGPFTWTRTPAGQHGNVFVNSTLIGIDKPLPWTTNQKAKAVFARLPQNGKGANTHNFPNAECVLISVRTSGVPVEGWGPIQSAPGFDSSKVRFYEYNTMDVNGRPVDLSRRHGVVKVLKADKDAKTIADYSRPEFVLGGWKPVIE
jgi:pectinesterase